MTLPADSAYDAGLAMRRQVLGDAHVDQAMGAGGGFDADFQELVVRHVWGTVWTRPNLNARDRSFLNLAMLAALNRPNQLALHLKGALRNGLTREEINEIFIQVSAYCGVPAAADCFRIAHQVFREMGLED